MNKVNQDNSLVKNKDHASQNATKCELAIVVLQAGEKNDSLYLNDYLQMTKLSGELNINEQDNQGCSPLHYAVSSLNISIVQCLINHSAFANVQDVDGYTPLIWACAATAGEYSETCSKKSAEIASYLIENASASIHIETNAGQTPLHVASASGNLECVKLLLKHGADLNKKDHNNRSVTDLATDLSVKNYLLSISTDLKMSNEKCNFCAECGKNASETILKRCGNCFSIRYCGKSCQVKHWKAIHSETCSGSLLCKNELITINSNYKCKLKRECNKNKKFIVKIQLPLMDQDTNSGLYMYNHNRSISGFIVSTQTGYDAIKELIIDEGYVGIKAFFWASLDQDLNLKIYFAQCAPFQEW